MAAREPGCTVSLDIGIISRQLGHNCIATTAASDTRAFRWTDGDFNGAGFVSA